MQVAWNSIPVDYLRRLIENMPAIRHAIFDAEGGYTSCWYQFLLKICTVRDGIVVMQFVQKEVFQKY